jgi:hypothetical protein
MHRIVIWSFALALVPLTIAVVRELVAMATATHTGPDPLDVANAPHARAEPAYNKQI